MNGVVTAAASAPVADLVTAACILGMIVFGGQRGLFLATAAAFAVLTAFFSALASHARVLRAVGGTEDLGDLGGAEARGQRQEGF